MKLLAQQGERSPLPGANGGRANVQDGRDLTVGEVAEVLESQDGAVPVVQRGKGVAQFVGAEHGDAGRLRWSLRSMAMRR